MHGVAGIKRGPSIHASPGWVALARETMQHLGWGQQELAAACGTDDATISRFFNPEPGEPHRSRYANEMADKLGIPRPSILITTADEARWHQLGRLALRLDRTRYDAIVAAVTRAVGGALSADDADRAVTEIIGSDEQR